MMLRKLCFVVSMCGALVAASVASAQEKALQKVVAAKPVIESAQLDIVETAAKGDKFKTLVAAVRAAGLVETLKGKGPFTVFAPTDEAFAKLPKGTVASLLEPENKAKLATILTYHVVSGKVMAATAAKLKSAEMINGETIAISAQGKMVRINNAKVTKADIVCSNGVIHVIDTVLMPNAQLDIVEVAAKAGKFNTLVTAVRAAGLVETLQGIGPFTVFAPTDEAFAKLPKGTVESLLEPENKAKLAAILTYHVVPGKVMAATAAKLKSAETVNGDTIAISVRGKEVKINDAKVTKADLGCKNGVIHVIDTVLMPK